MIDSAVYRAIVVQLGGWESLTVIPTAPTQEMQIVESRHASLRGRIARLDDAAWRRAYEQVLDDAARSIAQWREHQEFQAAVVAALKSLPVLPPE